MSTPTLPTGMITTLVAWRLNWVAEDFAAQNVALTGARGSVLFEPTAVAVNYPDTTVLPAPVETRVADGVMRLVRLTANDPEVWNWKVTPRVGVPWEPFHIDVPADKIQIDLATVAAVPGKGPIRAVTGATGAPGPQGIQGLRGETGALTDVAIGTVSGGDVASATMRGFAPSKMLDLVLPRGEQGLPGVNAIPADEAVAAYIRTTSQTKTALEAAYRAHVSVAEYGAVGDGATDDTAAVQDAFAAGAGGTVYFPPGHYRLTGPLTVPRDTTVSGAGSASVTLDWSTMAAFTATSLLAWEKGTVGPGISLAQDVARGATSVTLTTGHGLVAGDPVRVLSDEVIVSGEATKAEFQRVLSVDGDALTFGAPLFDSYSLATGARVQKTDLITGGLSGVSIRGKGINPTGYGDTVVEFSLAQDVTIRDVKFRDVENKCMLLNSVVGLTITDCHFYFDPSFTPLQYGIALTGACQMVSISAVRAWNDRHMVTTSTSSTLLDTRTEYRGIPRFVSITGCTAYGSWQSPIDTHRGGEYITITGNSLTSESAGIKIRGANILISGNTIVGKTTSGGGGPNGIYIGMLCDSIQIIGNFIRGFRDGVRFDTPDQPSRGLVVSSNHIVDCERPVFVGSTSTMYRLKIDGNYLRALPGTSNYPVYLVTTVEDIEITGNTLEGGNMGVYIASPTLPVTRALVQGNVVRGQASFGMFFRNLTDALVTGNHVVSSDIRFTDVCVRVTTGLNLATVTDLTTGTTIIQK